MFFFNGDHIDDFYVSTGNGLTCYCQGHCLNDNFNGTCEARPFSQCFAAVEEVYNPDTGLPEPEYTYGCLPPEEKGLMQVCCDSVDFSRTLLCNILSNSVKDTWSLIWYPNQ